MELQTLQQIEQYLNGHLNSGELAAFEARLEVDAGFKQEVEFQSLIKQGLGAYRKQQLKSKLEAIELAPAWMSFLQQSAFVKSLGGILAASVVGLIIYNAAEYQGAPVQVVDAITVNAPVEVSLDSWQLNLPVDEAQTRAVVGQLPSEVVANDSQKMHEAAATFIPKVQAPDVADVTDNNTFHSQSPPPMLGEARKQTDEEPLEVKVSEGRSEKVRYSFFDGKLFLHGNFEKTPYEILDINGSKDRRLYLYHQAAYFELQPTDKIRKVDPIQDAALIAELDLIRKSRQ